MAEINEQLRSAARRGSKLRLKALLRAPGGDALAQDEYGLTALMYAAYYGHEGCVKLLLPASDALAQSSEGRTALMWAAYQGHEDCVRLLLSVSDTLVQDAEGRTAGTWARNRGHESLARLIEAYALAQSERSALETTVPLGAPRGREAFRM